VREFTREPHLGRNPVACQRLSAAARLVRVEELDDRRVYLVRAVQVPEAPASGNLHKVAVWNGVGYFGAEMRWRDDVVGERDDPARAR
jgi:hypothetical protein